VRLALLDQEEARLDIVTDGEQRRRHYIWGFLEGLTGTDTERLGPKQQRGGRYLKQQDVARIVGELTRPRPIMVDALAYTKLHTRRPVKVALPGPMTIVDSTLDEYYGGDEEALAMRLATLLNAEARDLAAAGADVIQFDEPCFNIYLDKVRRDAAAAGRDEDRPDLRGVRRLGRGRRRPRRRRGKDVLLGVIDVGAEEVESPELVAARIEKALAYVSPEHLFPCTDCGMVPRTRAAARGRGTARANRRGRHDLDGRLAQALLVVAWLGDGIRGAR